MLQGGEGGARRMTPVSARPDPAVGNIRPLPRAFFARDPRRVAREILGKLLVREGDVRQGDMHRVGRVVEVEAYLGEKDPAAHAAAGNTERTRVLFGPPGYAYVYFIYGNHYCLNVSCEREGKAGSVLFRALEPLLGIESMAHARKLSRIEALGDPRRLTSGPGRLAEAFGITRARDNGSDLTSSQSSLWLGEDNFADAAVRVSPRIGITKATANPLRYFLAGNRLVSGPRLRSSSG
jgi:DNA-3-methyladenine glycosylase